MSDKSLFLEKKNRINKLIDTIDQAIVSNLSQKTSTISNLKLKIEKLEKKQEEDLFKISENNNSLELKEELKKTKEELTSIKNQLIESKNKNFEIQSRNENLKILIKEELQDIEKLNEILMKEIEE